MKKSFACLIILLVVFTCLGQTKERLLVNYDWKYEKSLLLNDVKVPANYKEETKNYREGIISYLKYKDGSYIVIHRGGMIKLPFFAEESFYTTESKEKLEDRVFRCGKSKNQRLYWCEVNFKRAVGIPFPTNFAFDKVKKEDLILYKESLKTLVLQEQNRIKTQKEKLVKEN